jgi:dihydroorotate dehydrogenase electron transfer subunit
MIEDTVTVLWNRPLARGIFHMGLSCREGYGRARAGQFVMVGLRRGRSPLLRRPFSIHRLVYDGGVVTGIELLYKTVGTGTRILSECREGHRLDLLGPLGRGFHVPPACRRVFLAAGGIGVAPLVFLADSLVAGGIDAADSTVFIGGRSGEEVLCADAFRQLRFAVVLTTDDGTLGDQCLVTHPLELAAGGRPPEMIYACGPLAMLDCVAGMAGAMAIPCQVSIESVMACGMGACLGCAVRASAAAEGYLHVCRDGPVFEAKALGWQGDPIG